MKNIKKVKEDLKSVQKNFNPEKSTYQTIKNLITNNYTANEMISILSKIKGVSKYPEHLKDKFVNIIDDLKQIEQDEIRKKEEERIKEEEKKQQEEKTKELKDIIDALEKEMKKPKKEKEDKDKEIQKQEIKLDIIKEMKIEEPKKEEDEDEEPEEIEETDKGKKLFTILLISVIITFLIALAIFFLY